MLARLLCPWWAKYTGGFTMNLLKKRKNLIVLLLALTFIVSLLPSQPVDAAWYWRDPVTKTSGGPFASEAEAWADANYVTTQHSTPTTFPNPDVYWMDDPEPEPEPEPEDDLLLYVYHRGTDGADLGYTLHTV